MKAPQRVVLAPALAVTPWVLHGKCTPPTIISKPSWDRPVTVINESLTLVSQWGCPSLRVAATLEIPASEVGCASAVSVVTTEML